VARPGKVFVGADYSQLEPRVFAYFSKDERLLNAFIGDNDFYSVIGIENNGLTDCTASKQDKPDSFRVMYKSLRDETNVFCLASVYGATAHQLAPTVKKSVDDTQALMDTYFDNFPGVREYQLESHLIAKETGQVANLFGRPRRMPEAKRIVDLYGNVSHGELPYEMRNVLNLAVNHRIQSTGASIINRAMIAFCNNAKAAGIDCKIVLQVHDSLVVECQEKDAENITLLLQDAMENTVDLKTVKLEAVPKIGRDLSVAA
jgi:DNA polymerase-1